MKNKRLVIGCSAAFVIFVVVVGALVGLLYAKLYRPFFSSGDDMPPELNDPGIVAGESFLTRTEFLKLDSAGLSPRSMSIGRINDLAVITPKNRSDIEVIIAGTDGAMITDQNAEKLSSIKYQFEVTKESLGPVPIEDENHSIGELQIVDLENDQVYEYLGRGSIDGAALFDHEGKRLWAYGDYTEEKTSIDNMTVGDLDGDGIAEYVTLWEGIELFDRTGKRIWQQESQGSHYQLEVVDTDGDGKNEIIHSSGSDLIIRDRQGRIIKEIDMPYYISDFTVCAVPGKKDQPCLMSVEDGYVWLVNFKGETVAKFQAPLSDLESGGFDTPYGRMKGTSVYQSKGVWVNLAREEPDYLAVITEYAALDRSVLYVYKPSGQLVYQEVLPERCVSIAVWPKSGADGMEGFLVGGQQTIWRYNIH